MGMMKTLAIAMEDGALDEPDHEEVRQAGWHDALNGIYRPENYLGQYRKSYRLGRIQFEEARQACWVA